MLPGDRARAFVTFLSPSAHWGRLGVGKAFSIREGGRVVAHGRVEQLLDLCESAIRERVHELLESRYRYLVNSSRSFHTDWVGGSHALGGRR